MSFISTAQQAKTVLTMGAKIKNPFKIFSAHYKIFKHGEDMVEIGGRALYAGKAPEKLTFLQSIWESLKHTYYHFMPKRLVLKVGKDGAITELVKGKNAITRTKADNTTFKTYGYERKATEALEGVLKNIDPQRLQQFQHHRREVFGILNDIKARYPAANLGNTQANTILEKAIELAGNYPKAYAGYLDDAIKTVTIKPPTILAYTPKTMAVVPYTGKPDAAAAVTDTAAVVAKNEVTTVATALSDEAIAAIKNLTSHQRNSYLDTIKASFATQKNSLTTEQTSLFSHYHSKKTLKHNELSQTTTNIPDHGFTVAETEYIKQQAIYNVVSKAETLKKDLLPAIKDEMKVLASSYFTHIKPS